MMKPTVAHPARFSDAILECIADKIIDHAHFPRGRPLQLLDPFAGVGRCFELEEIIELPIEVWGIELEPEWISDHPRHVQADSLAWMNEMIRCGGRRDIVATSPAYGNRMADSHQPSESDTSKRHTYRHYLGRPLSENNSGGMQWGKKYRDFHALAWNLVFDVLRPGGLFVLNVKSHVRDAEIIDVAAWHKQLAMDIGFELLDSTAVSAPGLRHGRNAETRVDVEFVHTFRRP